MTRSYVQSVLRRSVPIVNDELAEPCSVRDLRDVLRRRAKTENGNHGRSDLPESDIIAALDALDRGNASASVVGRTENFLGGVGLARIRDLKITLTSAGHALLQDAARMGMRP